MSRGLQTIFKETKEPVPLEKLEKVRSQPDAVFLYPSSTLANLPNPQICKSLQIFAPEISNKTFKVVLFSGAAYTRQDAHLVVANGTRRGTAKGLNHVVEEIPVELVSSDNRFSCVRTRERKRVPCYSAIVCP